MPPVEWPTSTMRDTPAAASNALVLAARSWKLYCRCAGLVDLQNPIWSGAITR